MTLSEEQKRNIDAAFDAANSSLTVMKRGIRDGRDRIKRLTDAGFHIERLMVNAQLVEHAVKNVLHVCRLKKEVAEIIGVPDPYANVGKNEKGQKRFEKQFAKFNKQPLGVITVLLRQTTKEHDLADKLDKFSEFRQEFVHQAFNGSHDLVEMDKKADQYLTHGEDFPEMVMALQRLHKRIQQEISALH